MWPTLAGGVSMQAVKLREVRVHAAERIVLALVAQGFSVTQWPANKSGSRCHIGAIKNHQSAEEGASELRADD